MNREEALAKLRSMPKFNTTLLAGFLPSAVVESRVGHLKPVQKLYTYVFKMGGFISSYKYIGDNKIEVEVQVPFPVFPPGDGEAPVTVYVELEP